jgi:fructose-1,6-bisphosphatase/inositol monophosphatase family enzyme
VTTDLAFAHMLADAADAISFHHFGSDTLRVETKPDGAPVTAIDRAVEGQICDRLALHPPADGYLGEEVGHSYLAEPFLPVANALRRRDPDAQVSFAHAALAVAAGETDAVLVLRGGAWDYAAVAVIVEEAGGAFSDLWGGRRLDTGTALYSNALLHPAILAAAARSRPAPPDPV